MPDSAEVIPSGSRVQMGRVRHDSFGVLRLGRGASPAEIEATGALLGLELPQAPNCAAGARPRALWTGPLEWTVIDASPDQVAALQEPVAGVLSHYADITDARAGFRLLGPDAARLVASECPLDLAALPPGGCAQSVFAGMPILLDRRLGEDGLRLYVDISLADHLNVWLIAVLEGLT
jgi:heterotetrameric sarcosine oxidase gamma subunit